VIKPKPMFRAGSVQEKVFKAIIAGQSFDQILKKLKTNIPALVNVLVIIKKKTGIKCRGHEELFKLIIERGKTTPAFEDVVGAPTTGIDNYRALSPADKEIAKDNDDVDLAANILRNKIMKCGRANGRAEIVRRVVDHAISEIKMLISAEASNAKK